MYNYIWTRRPDTGEWARVHNFGIDVRSFAPGDDSVINCIGVNLGLQRAGQSLHVTYPRPLIQYRQFDDKVGDLETIRRYPDFSREEMDDLVHADASVTFRYEIDPHRPSFVMSGEIAEGRIYSVVYIVSALWTDNHALPTHAYFEGFAEYDITSPEAVHTRATVTENVAYTIFYRADGNGVPYALLPLRPERAGFYNLYDNWECLNDFRKSCYNQQFIAQDPPVKDCNDTGYFTEPDEDGTVKGVRVVFFPELGWRQGGRGHALRNQIEKALDGEGCLEPARSWEREERGLRPKLTLQGRPRV